MASMQFVSLNAPKKWPRCNFESQYLLQKMASMQFVGLNTSKMASMQFVSLNTSKNGLNAIF